MSPLDDLPSLDSIAGRLESVRQERLLLKRLYRLRTEASSIRNDHSRSFSFAEDHDGKQ